jgi:hypothetical protein
MYRYTASEQAKYLHVRELVKVVGGMVSYMYSLTETEGASSCWRNGELHVQSDQDWGR